MCRGMPPCLWGRPGRRTCGIGTSPACRRACPLPYAAATFADRGALHYTDRISRRPPLDRCAFSASAHPSGVYLTCRIADVAYSDIYAPFGILIRSPIDLSTLWRHLIWPCRFFIGVPGARPSGTILLTATPGKSPAGRDFR